MANLLEALNKEDNIDYAEPDYWAQFYYTPNDPKYLSQWWLPKIKAPGAWDLKKGDKAILVGIVDSGVATSHPDLKDNVVTTRETQQDTVGHGSHVAGIVSAVTDNNTGVAGTGFNVGLMAIDTDINSTIPGAVLTSDLVTGIIWASDNGARVINISAGGSNNAKIMQDAVDYAWSKGVIIVAAAGNNGSSTKTFPASYSNVISVAATDSSDKIASFSSYGTWVKMAAPGINIFSTNNAGGYETGDGTSYSSPIVAGAAALLLSAKPSLTNQQVMDTLCTTADQITGSGTKFSCGRLNLYAALASVVSSPPPSSSPTPSVPPTGGLSFKVRFQGINEQALNQIVYVTISGTGTSFSGNIVSSSDANGLYTISIGSAVPAGTYEVKVKGPSSLRRKYQNIVYSGANQVIDLTTLENQILKGGDATGDNRISIEDASKILSYYSNFSTPVVVGDNEMERADINKDGAITIQDVALVAINWSDLAVSGDN